MKYQAPFGSADPDAPYVDRNVPGAVVGSKVPAAAVEDPQRELFNLITAAGLTPDEDDLHLVAKAVQSGVLNYAVAGGTANAITIILAPVPDALVAGIKINVKIGTTNTGAVTINTNGLGAVNANRKDGGALAGGDLIAGEIVPFIFDGAVWRLQRLALSDLASSVASGSLIARRVFTASATYTPTAGTTKIHVTATGGGGGGGGGGGTTASTYAVGGGGGGGATVVSDFTSGFSSVAMTIGAGGGVASGGNGLSGGTTSFGALASAGGGLGGSVGPQASGAAVQAGGTGAVASGGSFLNSSGGAGGIAVGTSTGNFSSGFGGSSFWGAGGSARFSTSAGFAGTNYGSGGGGSANGVSQGTNAGGPGAPGVIVVEEYA
ncbi:hypothetical protein ACCS97_23465 [Rhizobium ruizarguesonis]